MSQPAAASREVICVACLVNQYPKLSHTFIRREIQALEAMGVRMERFSIRLCRERFTDEADLSEFKKTRFVLRGLFGSLFRLVPCAALAAATRPVRFLRALALTFRIGPGSDRGMVPHLAYLLEACVVWRWCVRSRVDRVHAHFATNSAAVAMLCNVLGGPPYSFTAHGPDDFDRARFLSVGEKIARAQFVVTVSSWGLSQLYRWCSYRDWPRMHVGHPGIDSGFLDHPRAPIPAARRLVCVGRLDNDKGQLLLLEALRDLIDEGFSCEVVMVGDGPLRETIAAKILELRLQGHAEMTGAVSGDELRNRIQSSRALVVPSFAENLPSVILEAFALGRPVIGTCIGGIPEVVRPGCNGWLVPAGSVESLRAAMREALSTDLATMERMGREGARCVGERFRSEDAARHLLNLFLPAHEETACRL